MCWHSPVFKLDILIHCNPVYFYISYRVCAIGINSKSVFCNVCHACLDCHRIVCYRGYDYFGWFWQMQFYVRMKPMIWRFNMYCF